MTWSKMLVTVGVALLALSVSTMPASAHMKLIDPPARNEPSVFNRNTCCADSTRQTPKINNFQCEIGRSETTTRASQTGKIMYEGRGYTLRVHLAVNHLGRVYHGIEDYAGTYPSTSNVNDYLVMTDMAVETSRVGEYATQQPYVLTLGTACTNCGWWSWYDTEAGGAEMSTTWTSCADITVIPVDFPLYYSTTADATGANTMFLATTPPTMTGEFYVNTPMPDVQQEDGTTLPANENEIADIRYTLLCPTGVTSPQCDTEEVDTTPRPFGASTAYNADTLPNGRYTVQSHVYFKLRDRAQNDLNRYRTYTAEFDVARDINCGNPTQSETNPTPYQCDPTLYLPKTADPSTLNCGQTECTPTICCDLRQTCDLFIAAGTPGCTAGTNTPITNPAATTCVGTTCTVTECCTPNQVCGDDGNGGYVCPTTHIRPLANIAGTTCATLTCTPTECCQPNETCGDYTCQPGAYHPNPQVPLTTVCNTGGVCTPNDCCLPNPRCDSYTCPPEAIQMVPNPAGVICATEQCQQSECCGDNQRCSATLLSPLCIAGSTTMKPVDPATILCAAALCVVDDCCDPNPLCSSYTCPADAVQPIPTAATTTCATDVCQTSECCVPNPVCATHTCPTGTTMVPDADRITCDTVTCTDTECCQPNQTCDQYGGCATGTMQPRQGVVPATITCAALLCTSQDCCEPNPVCVGYACPPLMAQPLPSPETITCALAGGPGSGCLDDECCAPNPTCAAFDCAGAPSIDSVFVDPVDKATRVCQAPTCTPTDCCELAFTCGNTMGVRTDQTPPSAFLCGTRGKVADFDTVVCQAARCDVDTCCVAVGGIIPLVGPVTSGTPIIPPGGGITIPTPDGGTTVVGTSSPPPGVPGPTTTTNPNTNAAAAGTGANPAIVPVDSSGSGSDDDDDSGTVVGIIVVLLLLCCLLLAGLMYRNKRRSNSSMLQFAGTYRDVVAASANDAGLKGVGNMDDEPVVPTDQECVQEMAIASSSESESEPSIVSSSESDTEPEVESDSSEEEVEAPSAPVSMRPDRPAPVLKKKKAAPPSGAAPKLKKKPKLPAPKLNRAPKGAAPKLQKKVIAVGAGEAAPPPKAIAVVAAGGGGAAPPPQESVGVGAGGGGGGAMPELSAGIGAGGGSGGPIAPPVPQATPAQRPSVRRHKGAGRAGKGGRTASVQYSVGEVKNIQAPICNTVVPVMGAEFMELIKGMNKNKIKEEAMTHDGTNKPDRSQTIG